jgi:predicted SnoaL-like aldol condensation-catalyzing enzyme
MNRKEIASAFLNLASAGRVREAYERFIHPGFRHHNAYFKGDWESLKTAMEANARQYPGKRFETLRALEDGELVAVHGRVRLTEGSEWSVIHIFRFDDGKIVELWEASQEALKNSPNGNGLF